MAFFCRKRLPNFNTLLLFVIFIAGSNYSSQTNTQISCDQDLHTHCIRWAKNSLCFFFERRCRNICNLSCDTGCQGESLTCRSLAQYDWCTLQKNCNKSCNLTCGGVPVRTTQTTAAPTTITTVTNTTTAPATVATPTTTSHGEANLLHTAIQRAVAEIKALNVTDKGSLMDAVDAISKLFQALEKKSVRMCWNNVFATAQKLDILTNEYTKVHFEADESRVIHTEYYVMIIKKIAAGSKAGVVCSFNATKSSAKTRRDSISIPAKTFHGQGAVVVCMIYKNVKRCFTEDEQTHNDNKALNLKLGSRIIAASVYPAPSGTLEENVTISLTQDDGFKKEDIPHCRFWDHSTLNGSWSSRGCSLVKSINNEITCTCNHLTNFAVLMQVSATKGRISSKHSLALEVITYIGCALSLAGEVLTIIAYCVLMNLKQEKIQIRLNLVVAIASAQIAFLSGINTSEPKGVCVLVAALIHFFYLAGFAWMLFEGVYLYLMVVKVFNIAVRMRVFYAAAWGLPVVIVVVSIVIASSQDSGVHSYVYGDFCWVSFSNNLIWTFVTPVLLVCLINSVFLGLVLREIVKMQPHNSEMKKLRQGTKAFVVLFPLLGMTWVFGVLSVTDAGLVFQYIFTILNSLQGFFIFMLHVVRNEDVRAEFKRKKLIWKDARSINASLFSPQEQTNTWTNKAVKSNAHELESRANQPASWPNASTGYDNGFIFHKEKCITPVGM